MAWIDGLDIPFQFRFSDSPTFEALQLSRVRK